MAASWVKIVMIKSLLFNNSLGVVATWAPKWVRAVNLEGVRFQTVTEWPNSKSLSTKALPMRPVPARPIFNLSTALFLFDVGDFEDFRHVF